MIEITVLASGSRGNCYRINDGSTPLLLECGIPYKEIQKGLNFRLSELAGCLISHEHQDHCKAILDVIKAGIDCYMSQGTAGALGVSGHRVRMAAAKYLFEIGTLMIMPFETQHDADQPLGFLVYSTRTCEKLLYATDTYYIRYKFPGLTHIMVECNYIRDILEANVSAGLVPLALRNRLLESHFSLENVKAFLQANDLGQVKGIWLIHMSETNCDPARAKREIQEMTGLPVYIAQEVALCR